MATDPSILLGYRPAQPIMPAQIEQLQLQREAAADAAEARKLAVQQRAMELRDKAVYARIMEQTGGDLEKAEPLIRQFAPRYIKQLNEDQQAQHTARKSSLEAEKLQTEMGLGLVGVLMKNPTLHAELAPIIAKRVPDLAGVIDKLDPNDPAYGDTLASVQRAGMTAKDQIDQAWKELDAQLRREDAAAGRAVTMRGQDLSAETARTGQQVTLRGQDLSAETTRRGQNIIAGTAANRLAFDQANAPLESVVGPDGKAILAPRSQARGMRPGPGSQGGGRNVTSGDAGRIAEIQDGLTQVQRLRTTATTNTSQGTSAAIGAALPNWVTQWTGRGASAKSKQAVVDLVKQIIGKGLEGGVLRKEDESKYAKILPTISDPPQVVQAKIEGLDATLQEKRENLLSSLEDAGYNTSAYRARESPRKNPYK